MLSAAERRRLTVVLVGARNPANIGAAARAMQDFGFGDLRVVNEYGAPFEAAQIAAGEIAAGELASGELVSGVGLGEVRSAVAAGGVMRAARRFEGLAEAIADCTVVVGTTAIGERGLRQKVVSLQEAAPGVVDGLRVEGGRVALLFGSEKTGLTTEQLSYCQRLMTIPMYQPLGEDGGAERHLSMNLGQSVAVCLYELSREGFEGVRELPVLHEAAATAEDRERLTQLLLDAMHVTGYSRRFPANANEMVVRQLAMQLGVSHREAMTWMGVWRQVLWRGEGSDKC